MGRRHRNPIGTATAINDEPTDRHGLRSYLMNIKKKTLRVVRLTFLGIQTELLFLGFW